MKKLIAANWKMNKTVEEAVSAVNKLKELVKDIDNADIAVCPPFTALKAVSEELEESNIKLGAQNMHFEDAGAFTGEVSPVMLKEIGCQYVILGHSDRRGIFGERDSFVNKKIIAALKHSLNPILCVGENAKQRKSGKTKEVIESQVKKCLENIDKSDMAKVSIAYEPIWAISRGNPNARPATAKDAEESHKFIRNVLKELFGEKTAKNTKIIYGGSMKPGNAKELLAMPDIDGGLIGNASLDAKSFAGIVSAAK